MSPRWVILFSGMFLLSDPCLAPPIQSSQVEQGNRKDAKQPVRRDAHGDLLPEKVIARLGTIRLRPGEMVLSLAYSPDGKFVVTGAYGSGSVRLWNTATGEGELVYSMESSFSGQQKVSFSPDGKYITYIGKVGPRPWEAATMIWEVATKRSFLLSNACTPFAFSPDSKLTVGMKDHDLVIFDVTSRSVKMRVSYLDGLACAPAFSSDGKLVAATEGRPDHRGPSTLRLWDVASGKQVAEKQEDSRAILSLSFSPDGKVLALATRDLIVTHNRIHYCILLWDVASRKEIAVLDDKPVGTIAFSPNGKLLAGRDVSSIHLWDTVTRKQVRVIHTGAVGCETFAFSPDGKTLATAGYGHALQLWDVETGRQALPLTGHEDSVFSLQFSPDGKTLASYGGDLTVRLWDVGIHKERRRFVLVDSETEINRATYGFLHVHSVSFSPDGKRLAAIGVPKLGKPDTPLHVWNTASGDRLFTLQAPRPKSAGFRPTEIAFSPDGQTLAAANRGEILFWSAASAVRLSTPLSNNGGYLSMAFSPDGRSLAAGESGQPAPIQIWDAAGSRKRYDFPSHKQGVSCLAFSPDGHLLASTSCQWGQHPSQSDLTIQIREPATGTLLRSLAVPQGSASCIAFSPDGRLLAFVSPNAKVVRLWDVFTGKELTQFAGHRGPVYCVAFSPDGKTVASGSADTTILLWDVRGLGTKPPATNGDPKTLADLWAKMLQQEAATSYRALWELVGAGDKAVVFLAQHLHPASATDPKRFKQWLADLDSEDFSKRQTAAQQLTRLGLLAEPALRQALSAKPGIEVRKRIEQILAEIAEHPYTMEEIRSLRAFYALELIGSPAARDLLKKLADGASGAALTCDAKLALQRLERRAKTP